MNRDHLVPGECLALRDLLDPQVNSKIRPLHFLSMVRLMSCCVFILVQVVQGRKVRLGRRGLQVLVLKGLMVNLALQVSQGSKDPKAPLASLETQDDWATRVRKVGSSHHFTCVSMFPDGSGVQNYFRYVSGLMGPQGQGGGTGPPGQNGVPGACGRRGERGMNGQDGAPGCEGPKGEKGNSPSL